ncbi:unnamed protein product, partial [Ixodes hexagonus]
MSLDTSHQRIKVTFPKKLVLESGGRPNSIYLGLRTQNAKGRRSVVSNIVPVSWNIATSAPTGPRSPHPHPHPNPQPYPGPAPDPPAGPDTTAEESPPEAATGPEESKGSFTTPLLVGFIGVVLVVAVFAGGVYMLRG